MAEIKFEEALKKLEKIVSDLEAGKLSLDESLKKYEEGVRLVAACSKLLEQAQKKVEVLTKKEGSFQLKSFEEDQPKDKEDKPEGSGLPSDRQSHK